MSMQEQQLQERFFAHIEGKEEGETPEECSLDINVAQSDDSGDNAFLLKN